MPPAPPELMDDAVREILLRIPSNDPSHLLRASLVCKRWCRLLTDPAFLRRYRAFHRTPPVLGFVRNQGSIARFVSTSAFHPRDPERRNCRVLDCRHGRVLLHEHTTRDFLVWDPISGEDERIPNDIKIFPCFNAAVLCAADDCDHLDCHGGPFLVVLVATYNLEDEELAGAWVYSSEAGEWSAPTTVEKASDLHIDKLPPIFSEDKLYFIFKFSWAVLRYDLHGERGLSVIDGHEPDLFDTIVLIPSEDGGLRFAGLNDSRLDLWSLEMMDPDGDAAWRRRGVIQLEALPRNADSMRPPNLIGFAKAPDSDVVFVNTDGGVFMIQLESREVKKVYEEDCGHHPIFPYVSFSTPDHAVGRLCFG